jgi:RHS repeat-associated protein
LTPITEFNAPPDFPMSVQFSKGVLLHDGAQRADVIFLNGGSTYIALHGTADTLEQNSTGWTLRKPDGRILQFNQDGYLTSDRDRFGNGFTVEYEPTPLFTLYRRHCSGSQALTGEKICQMLAYVFGEAHARQFYYDGTYAWGATQMYPQFIGALEFLRDVVRNDMADGVANDPLSINMQPGPRAIVVRARRPQEPGSPDFATNADLNREDAVAASDALVASLTTIIQTPDLFKKRALSRDQLGRAGGPLFDQLRADHILTNDAGTPAQSLGGDQRNRLFNFNLALVAETLYPGIVTGHEYADHPQIESLLQSPHPNPPAQSSVPESSRYSRAEWNRIAYGMLRRYIYLPTLQPVLRTRYGIDGGLRFRPVRVTDDLKRTLEFEYYGFDLGYSREAGLLKQVSGPGGAKIEFLYSRPDWYPDVLNEMFLTRVTRNDKAMPVTSPVQPTEHRGYQFTYAWDTPRAEQIFTDWAWVVWRGVENAQLPYGALAAAHYLSSVADNIIRVFRFGSGPGVIESESAYVVHPLDYALDHVVAQRHGGTETGSAGGVFRRNNQTLITWASGLPQATFDYPRPLVYYTALFLPPAVRFRHDLEDVPPDFQATQSTDYQAPYFPPPADASEHPNLIGARNGCDQIRQASTLYAGWSISYSPSSKQIIFNPLKTGEDTLSLENIFRTRDRTRSDSLRICAWASMTSADGELTYYGLNFRGEALARATRTGPGNGDFFFEEFLYNEDGASREVRKPQSPAHWGPNSGSIRLVYKSERSLDPAQWRRHFLAQRIVEAPRDGSQDGVAARFTAFVYEPVYNQTARIQRGVILVGGTEHVHYQTDFVFCGATASDSDEANLCGATRPRALILGDPVVPSAARRQDFTWAPHGQPASIAEPGGASLQFSYYAGLGPDTPDAEAVQDATNRGMPARIRRDRFDVAYGQTDGLAAPCPLLQGPYQWVLPPSCQDAAAELSKRGLSDAAVTGILEASSGPTVDQLISYAVTGNPREVHEASSRTVLTTDTDGRVISRAGPGNLRLTFSYTPEGWLHESRRLDPLGNVVSRVAVDYDREGRMKERRQNLRVDRIARTSYRYSPGGRLAAVTSPLGAVEEFGYNSLGQVTQRQLRPAQEAPVERMTRYSYTRDGDIELTKLGLDATRDALGPIDFHFSYDGFRRLRTHTDEHGRVWAQVYNERSQVERLTQQYADPVQAAAAKYSGKPFVSETAFTYDSHGRLASSTDNGILVARSSFTPDGRLVRLGASGFGDTFYSYDRNGALVWSRDAAGNQILLTHSPDALTGTESRIAVDAGTRRIVVNTELAYDPRGMLSSRQTRGGSQSRGEHWSYSDAGNLYQYIDPAGIIQNFSYNFTGHADSIGEPGGGPSEASYEYDELQLDTAITDFNGQQTSLAYSSYGEIAKRQPPGFEDPIRYRYDGYGRLSRVDLPDGERIRYEYNPRNFLAAEHLMIGSNDIVLRTIAYNERGQITDTVENNPSAHVAVSTHVNYDDNGRTANETTTIANRTLRIGSRWLLDASGRWRRILQLPSGTSWTSQLDALGRLGTLTRSGSGPADSLRFSWLGNRYAGRQQTVMGATFTETVGFDSFGARNSWRYTAGQTTMDVRAVRDVRGRVGLASLSLPASRLLAGYHYTPGARLDGFWEASQPLSATLPAMTENSDDPNAALGWGATVGAPQWNVLYEGYDAISAIEPVGGGTRPWETPPRTSGYRLASVSIAGTPLMIQHDALGRLRRSPPFEYTFDARGRLVRAQALLKSEAYLYDGFGRLAAILSNGTALTRYVYDNSQIVAAYDEGLHLQWEAAWGPGLDRLVEFRRNGQVFIPMADHRNSAFALFDAASQHVTGISSYDTFGNLTRYDDSGQPACRESGNNTCTAALPFGFTGALRSDLTGLTYLRSRWYSPRLLQFLSPDQAGYVDSYNPYVYAANDPVNRWDPMGNASTGFSRIAKMAGGYLLRGAERLYLDPVSPLNIINPVQGLLVRAFFQMRPTALQASPDPFFLANLNPALGAATSASAAMNTDDPWEAGFHAADAVGSAGDTVMAGLGGVGLVRGGATLLTRLAGSAETALPAAEAGADGKALEEAFDNWLEAENVTPEGPYETSTRLMRGNLGEKQAAEALAERGLQIVQYKPSILGTNQGGIDIVAVQDGVAYLIDNKAVARAGNISSVSALTTNLDQNLNSVLSELTTTLASPSTIPEQRQVLQTALDSINNGTFRLAVTNANSNATGVTQKLADQGIEFINLLVP